MVQDGPGVSWEAAALDEGTAISAVTDAQPAPVAPLEVRPGTSERTRPAWWAVPPAPRSAARALRRTMRRQRLSHGLHRALGALMCLIALPLLTVCAALILREGRGRILFRQRRVGQADRPWGAPVFTLLKFRSMAPGSNAAEDVLREPSHVADGIRFKHPRDPRITRVGRLLRRWSLDELPQLWNVVCGDLVLIGPRPPTPSEVRLYALDHRRRLHGPQGLTGPWQVAGRSEIGFREQVELDAAYLANRTWRGDLLLLAQTIPAVLGGRGAW